MAVIPITIASRVDLTVFFRILPFPLLSVLRATKHLRLNLYTILTGVFRRLRGVAGRTYRQLGLPQVLVSWPIPTTFYTTLVEVVDFWSPPGATSIFRRGRSVGKPSTLHTMAHIRIRFSPLPYVISPWGPS